MSIPTITATGSAYQLVWQDEQIEAQVRRIHEDGDQNLKAEVTLRSFRIDTEGKHLHQAQLNLSSTSARGTLAKRLQQSYRFLDDEWVDIVEQLCVLVIREHRKGEPVISLAEVEESEASAYRLKPILAQPHPSLIYGDGGGC